MITVYVDNESLCGRLMNKCLEFFFSNTRSLRANSSSGVSSNQCKSSLSVSVPMIRLSAFAVVIGATAANNRNNRKRVRSLITQICFYSELSVPGNDET